MTARRFHYDGERTERNVRRRQRANEFPSLIERAEKRGETGPLREYLLSDLPLSGEHRGLLADLIYRRIQRKGRGKRGDPAPRPHEDAVRRVAFRVRQLQAARGWRNLSKDRLATLVDEAGSELAEAGIFDGLRHKITIDDIKSALRPLRRR